MDATSRTRSAQPRPLEVSSSSAMVREAKGLAIEFKSLLKRKEPWDRDLEFQRESLRKAYLRVIFAGGSEPRCEDRSLADRPRTASSSSVATVSSNRRLDTLNLLWLDTTHALISSYRARLAELDKQIASAPKAHKNKNKDRNQIGNGGEVLPAAVGPVARRKLVHSFRQFLGKEEDFWRTLCGRFASRLHPEEAAELRSVGIIASTFYSSHDAVPAGDRVAQPPLDGAENADENREALRTGVLPLAHKALICFGDLARYSELYSEASPPPALESGRGRGRGGKRGGKSAATGDRRSKTYSRAAECYNQARLLMPDNGNPSNQLAVLAQYAADPLSSIYHYYRALCVRTPFATAKANLKITFSKAVARWFSPEGGEPDGHDDERFKAAFIVLHGIFFTKEKVSELPKLSLRLQDLFRNVISGRLLTSDVIFKIVTTSLAALWDARVSRSSLTRSKNGSTIAGPSAGGATLGTSANLSSSSSRNLEPHILLNVLALLRLLLTRSTLETIEILNVNEAQRPDDKGGVSATQNISAVLRRALPAIRILTKWLVSQLDYVARVEARVEASERRRHRTSNGEEAQQQSIESSASRESSDSIHISLDEFRASLDSLWIAYADFANVLNVAFPQADLPLELLDEGVWLEEDVELLGFVPLRRGLKGAGDSGSVSSREIRRVGRDVHPNDEHLMRVADVLRDAQVLADSQETHLACQDGIFSSVHRQARDEDAAAPSSAMATHAAEGVEEDEEMLDEATEDDPVDRAMRVATAAKFDINEYSSDEDDELDGEEIVYSGNRSANLTPARSPQAAFAASPNVNAVQPPAATDTTADLRHLLLSTGGAPPPITTPVGGRDAAFPSPLARAATHPSLPNIWAPTAGNAGSPVLGSGAFGALSPHAQPVTPNSFEAIPNLTHGSSAAHAAGWPTATSGALPPPPGVSSSRHESAFAPIAAALSRPAGASHAPPPLAPLSRSAVAPPGLGPVSARPPLQAHASLPAPVSPGEIPRLSTAFAGLQRQNSDLSPFAPTFGARWGPAQDQPRSNGWG